MYFGVPVEDALNGARRVMVIQHRAEDSLDLGHVVLVYTVADQQREDMLSILFDNLELHIFSEIYQSVPFTRYSNWSWIQEQWLMIWSPDDE